MKVLTLIRGASGSGKSWLAEAMLTCYESVWYSADDYFTGPDGRYRFDAKQLHAAHADCEQNVLWAMKSGIGNIIVHNTFTRQWELDPYLKLAKEHYYKVQIITCEADFGNVHGVPEETVKKQRKRFEYKITT